MESRIDVFIENSIKGDFIMSKLRTDFKDTKKVDFNDPKWTEYWQHNRKITRINKGISLKAFGVFLQDRGYTHITMEYEGSGDSGDSYHAEGFKSKENFNNRSGDYQNSERIGGWNGADSVETGTRNQKELLELFKTYLDHNPDHGFGKNDSEELRYVLSSMIDYDWYNNDGGQGEVIWNLKRETIKVEGEQNYQGQYDCKESYSLNGEEPKTKYKDMR